MDKFIAERSFLLGSAVIVLLHIQCLGQIEGWKGSIYREAGIKIVDNPRTPFCAPDILNLQEDYLIKSSGRGYQFVAPSRLVLDEKNYLYVLDIRDSNIKVFDDIGRYVRTIGRKGVGPGELDGPSEMDFNNHQLVVFCRKLSRLTYFDSHGNLLKTQPVSHNLIGMKLDSLGNVFGIDSTYDKNNEACYGLYKHDAEQKDCRAIAPAVKQPPLRFYSVSCPLFAISKGSQIIYGYPDKYEVTLYDNDGVIMMKIRKKHAPIPIPQTDLDQLKNMIKKGGFGPFKSDIPKFFVPFYEIAVDDEGRIFLQTQPSNSNLNTYDVFSPDGMFIATIKLRNYRPMLLDNKRLYAIEEDEEGCFFIRVSRVSWKY